MGFYAAPRFSQADAQLAPGYVPPGPLALSRILSPDGLWSYRAPAFNAVDATLEAGYVLPAPLLVNAVLSKALAGVVARTIYALPAGGWAVGTPDARLNLAFVEAAGIPAPSPPGQPRVYLSTVVLPAIHGPQFEFAQPGLYGGYSAPSPLSLTATLRRYGDRLEVGTPVVTERNARVRPVGFDGLAFDWQLQVRTAYRKISPDGFVASAAGTPTIDDTAIKPGGLASALFGLGRIWNVRQYILAPGLAPAEAGTPFVGGGVKTVLLTGLDMAAIGAAKAVDPKGAQTARPSGMAAPEVPQPAVSPRIVRPFGVLGTALGTPQAQFPPRPTGWDGAAYGTPEIGPWHRTVAPDGAEGLEVGYPVVADRARRLYLAPQLEAGIFGDAIIANRSRFVLAAGFDALAAPDWALIESNRRRLPLLGWASGAAGRPVIANAIPSIAPSGWDSLGGPAASVGYAVRTVAPAGFDRHGLGVATLTQPPSLAPAGIAGEVGTPTVWPAVRRLELAGRITEAIGAPLVGFRYRHLALAGVAAEAYGVSRVEHGRRKVEASGVAPGLLGEPWVSPGLRALAPDGFTTPRPSTGAKVGGRRFLQPDGFDAAHFGARVIPEIQAVYPEGFAGAFGAATFDTLRKIVAPAGFLTTGKEPGDRLGKPRAWNLRQYIRQDFDPESGLVPPAWPRWLQVELRNRTVGAVGFRADRAGEPAVENRASQLLPIGIAPVDPGPLYRGGLVAYRIRRLHLVGLEAPYIGQWAAVFNAARPVAPDGVAPESAGAPHVENIRRALDRIGGVPPADAGTPMVAPRVRGLVFEERYAIAPPQIELPEVKLRTRYVLPTGADTARMGWASLEIHWTIIAPRWTLQNLYGQPTLRKVTPEIPIFGAAMDVFGEASVRAQWRRVETRGDQAQLFGSARIADRKQAVSAAGWLSFAVGDKLTVEGGGVPPYALQTISLNIEPEEGKPQSNGYGIPPPEDKENNNPTQLGRPNINQQVIYVHQEKPATLFGNPSLTANSIRVEPGYLDVKAFGDHCVELWVRRLVVPEAEAPPEMPRPRVSPWTIWVTTRPPEQAVANHAPPVNMLHDVDGLVRDPGAIFGSATVTLKNRSIQVPGGDELSQVWALGRYGRPEVSLHRQVVTPAGIRSFRSGFHAIPGTQTLEQFESTDELQMGACQIGPPVVDDPFVHPAGMSMHRFGEGRVELFNRTLPVQGFDAARPGQPVQDDEPYQWQGLRVGPLMPTIPEGYDAATIGADSWVSNRVREVKGEGFDAFVCEYDLIGFDLRMRVRRGAAGTGGNVKPARPLVPAGFDAFQTAAPNIRPAVHYIRPDGNADQFRKGAF